MQYGGILAGALYSGRYNWIGANADMKEAQQISKHYGMDISEQLRLWAKTHRILKEFNDILEQFAEKLFRDKVLDDQYWEEKVLLALI